MSIPTSVTEMDELRQKSQGNGGQDGKSHHTVWRGEGRAQLLPVLEQEAHGVGVRLGQKTCSLFSEKVKL